MLERTPQAFLDSCFRLLWNSGYTATIDANLLEWANFYRSKNPNGVVNAATDPAHHDLNEANSFWLAVHRKNDGETIACIAQRMIVSDDFVEAQRTLEVWYADRAREKPPLILAMDREDYPEASGLIGHPAGLWVAKSERHNGLAWLLQRMARTYALVRWPNMEWQCGNTLEAVAARGLPINTYGYSRCDLLTEGWFEPTEVSQKVFMTSIQADEIVLQNAGDLSLIEMNPNQQVRDVVSAARERQGHAAVLSAVAG